MKIKVLLFIGGLICLNSNLKAQKYSLSISKGVNTPSIIGGGSDNPINYGNSFRFGDDYAINGGFNFSTNYSATIGLNYSAQGGIYQLKYLLVPVILRKAWQLNDHWDIFAGVGSFGGFLLGNNYDVNPGAMKDPYKFNAGVSGVTGISYKMDAQQGVFLELGSSYGFHPLQKPVTQAKGHSFIDTIRFGYTFYLEGNSGYSYHHKYQKRKYNSRR